MTALVVDGLTVAYGSAAKPLIAVDGISFTVAAGERLGIVGESGSGKTTAALAVLRLAIDGTDLSTLSPSELRASRLALASYIPQGAMNALNPVLSIGHQFRLALEAHGHAAPAAEIEAALTDVGLDPGSAQRYPHQLSGGQKQRVCIALSLMLRPRLIVADEPTSALDVVTQRAVMETLGTRQRDLGSALVLIGHDIGVMAQFVDVLAVMYAGRIVEIGPIDTLIRRPAHPYAAALVHSVPRLDARGELAGLPGTAPSLSDLPGGCRFHPRCAAASDRCHTTAPPAEQLAPGHIVQCHHPRRVA
jgi:oligopeptide/dipeptide ABC transporter ATP-binding protein